VRYLDSKPTLITTTIATGGASGQKVITTASTAGVVAGQVITGYGIPLATYVQSFVTNTSITITQNLTARATGTLYFYNSYYVARISGTSMAAPQVTGVLALFLQLYPDATPDDCKKWLANFGSNSNIMFTTGLDNDYTTGKSLLGQSNKYLHSPFSQDVVFKQSGGSA
jgi:subtilisin family serine protease